MRHWHCTVRLVVHQLRDDRYRASRDELANEDDTASRLTGMLATHVEPQVHFFERAMKRNRDAEHARVAKEKSDDADIQRSAPAIQFNARGYQRCEQIRGRLVVQHDEVAPFGSKKRVVGESLGLKVVVSIAVQGVPISNKATQFMAQAM